MIAELPFLGIAGWPLTRTFSPAMQQAALDYAGLGWRYGTMAVPPAEFAAFVQRAAGKMRGFNVTIPHKRAMFDLCTLTDRFASLSQSVNTVVLEPGHVHGYNTDGPGLIKALAERAEFAPLGCHAVLFGAGGAAAGCAAALGASGAASVTILNRTYERAEALCDVMKQKLPGVLWSAAREEVASDLLSNVTLVVSCVPQESASLFAGLLKTSRPGAVLVDLSYGEKPTDLQLAAKAASMKTVSGLEVLLWQGVEAFEIFTGISAPADVMRDALSFVAGRWWAEC
jgi:shikimate dehydrogenase